MNAKVARIRVELRFMGLYGCTVWPYLPNVPARLMDFKSQLIDLPARNHDQHVLVMIILPAPTRGLNPESRPFPGEVQRGDHTLIIKIGGNFDGFHHLIFVNIHFMKAAD